MSEVTMLSRMLRHWMCTFDTRANGRLTLYIEDRRLDTSAIYEVDAEQGSSALIVKAYTDYHEEYE